MAADAREVAESYVDAPARREASYA